MDEHFADIEKAERQYFLSSMDKVRVSWSRDAGLGSSPLVA